MHVFYWGGGGGAVGVGGYVWPRENDLFWLSLKGLCE